MDVVEIVDVVIRIPNNVRKDMFEEIKNNKEIMEKKYKAKIMGDSYYVSNFIKDIKENSLGWSGTTSHLKSKNGESFFVLASLQSTNKQLELEF